MTTPAMIRCEKCSWCKEHNNTQVCIAEDENNPTPIEDISDEDCYLNSEGCECLPG